MKQDPHKLMSDFKRMQLRETVNTAVLQALIAAHPQKELLAQLFALVR